MLLSVFELQVFKHICCGKTAFLISNQLKTIAINRTIFCKSLFHACGEGFAAKSENVNRETMLLYVFELQVFEQFLCGKHHF